MNGAGYRPSVGFHQLSPMEIHRQQCDANLQFAHQFGLPPQPSPFQQPSSLQPVLRALVGAVLGIGTHTDPQTMAQDQMRLYLLNKAQTWGEGRR